MNLKMKVTIALLTLGYSMFGYASDVIKNCPSMKVIRAEGLSEVRKMQGASDVNTAWYGLRVSEFQTSQKWLFAVGPFNDETAEQAMNSATMMLSNLEKIMGPFPADDETVCMYGDPEQTVTAVTVTPPVDLPPSLDALIHH